VDRTVRVWDAAKGQELLVLKGHSILVDSVCFILDGQRLASGGKDSTVRVWDAQTGQEVLVLKRPSSGLCGKVCFSPDGQRLVSASFRQVLVWEASSGGSEGD
jgi:WD40 repeat protein